MRLYHGVQRWLLERANIIVTTSPVILQNSESLSPYKDKAISIPIGIKGMSEDVAGAQMLRDRYGDRKIIFSLGRLVPYKGFRYLVEAAKYLPDNYVVLIGGEGPLLGELEQLRDSLGVSDKVSFCGRIPDEDLPMYYTACDVFCLPSVMKTEAFGIVQIEAMSIGKPVVATIIPGSGTAWVNMQDISGINVKPKDAGQLAKALQTVCGDSQNYARFCQGAKERFNTEFTLDLMVDRCLSLYEKMIINHSH